MADIFGDGDQEEDDDDMLPEEEEEEEDILDMEENTAVQQENALLMRFCPHDSSMLYPQVGSCIVFLFIFVNESEGVIPVFGTFLFLILSSFTYTHYTTHTGGQTQQNTAIRLSMMSIHRACPRSTPRLSK